jgi:hypothetical protein
MARMDPLERERQLLPRDKAREALGRIAPIIRSAGEALQRQFGPEAGELLFEAMDDAEREIERVFGSGGQELGLDSEREPDPDDELEPAAQSSGEASQTQAFAGWYRWEIDADHWKTWLHQRLSTPLGTLGAMTLFQASPQEHLALAKHLTAEVKTEEFVAGKGVVVKWERMRR